MPPSHSPHHTNVHFDLVIDKDGSSRHWWIDTKNHTSSFSHAELKTFCVVTHVLLILLLICAGVYAYRERTRRRRLAEEKGAVRERQGQYLTSLMDCIQLPRVCVPATLFTPVLAAFNRAEADHRECHFCDFLWSLKTPITQYHTRQSIRAEHNLEEAPCTDCLAAAVCTPCAVAQDALELERREQSTVPAQMVAPAAVTVAMPEVQGTSVGDDKGEYTKVAPAQV